MWGSNALLEEGVSLVLKKSVFLGLLRDVSRELREAVVKYFPSLPALALLIEAQRTLVQPKVNPLFYLVYALSLSILFVLVHRIYIETVDEIRNLERSRFPQERQRATYPDRIYLSIRDYFNGTDRHPHISEYDLYFPVEKGMFLIISLLMGTLIWSVVTLLLGLSLLSGLFTPTINVIRPYIQEIMSSIQPLISSSSGALLVVANEFFPNMTYESSVVIVLIVGFPAYIFVTAARNYMDIAEMACRWFLQFVYHPDGVLRRYEFSGYAILAILLGIPMFLLG